MGLSEKVEDFELTGTLAGLDKLISGISSMKIEKIEAKSKESKEFEDCQ
jgi:hypothetical protein